MPPPPLLLLLFFLTAAAGQPFDYPTATPPTVWTNNPSLPHSVDFSDGSIIRALLLRGNFGPSFAFGFFCPPPCNTSKPSFLLSISIVYTNSGSGITLPSSAFPQLLWSPNRHRPVSPNATLLLTPTAGLLLRDADGSAVWSSSASSASTLTLATSGNLLLLDAANRTLWDSFDYPTDTLVLGQTLKQNQRLTPNASSTQAQLYLTVLSDGLFAYVNSTPPQLYYQSAITGPKAENNQSYVKFANGSLQLFVLFTEKGVPDSVISLPQAASLQYMRFESDGHLRVYEWDSTQWKLLGDVLDVFPDDCAYPTVCGNYGVCSSQQCSCPNATYFREINARQPNLGCSPVVPLSCGSMQDHKLLTLDDVSYFNYLDSDGAALKSVDEESCKGACLRNCSCKAALFQYGGNASDGYCYLPSQIFSLMSNQPTVSHYNSTAYVKVQINPTPPSPSIAGPTNSPPSSSGKRSVGVIVGSVIGALLAISFAIAILFLILRRKKFEEMDEEYQFDQVSGTPQRFSYEQLWVATEHFCTKLGEGGFGSVFEGTLVDGTRVAVKRLDGIGQGKREFLAEVETIGSIHHINLVRLIGFCAEKSHRLLVYEYMCNGSLENWIFHGDGNAALDWPLRRKIIMDIAKGLSYLHEECRQKIVHLDIKPQNILLDEKFDAKVSDFGLSKFIDRDQTQVMTRMRGTPGYLAPEWLTSMITEKVDVYSFGVVVAETLCGRKNLDYSLPEDKFHLIALLHDMVKSDDSLFDLVDHQIGQQLHREEILRTMKLAMWCLQNDCNRRPSMSVVVKFLEGSVNVEASLDYDSSTAPPLVLKEGNYYSTSASPLPSLLSGPR